MDRQVGREDILPLLDKLRKNIPGVAIRTSFIVGFPGEGENEFKDLYNFIKAEKFERLGVFTYSQEEETMAYYFENQVPEEVKDERFNKIMELQQGIAKEVNSKFLGKTLNVLIDEESENDKNVLLGRTEYDAPEVDGLVYVNAKCAKPGDLIKVKITDTYEYDLVGDELT
jgi:ribosomal protein S12 methylthiotransferase